MKELEKLHAEINQEIEQFQIDSKKALNGNKSAGARSRKSSMALSKMFKDYRKLSVSSFVTNGN